MKKSARNLICYVCGAAHFDCREVLCEGLKEDWELSVEEAEYINRQQGLYCSQCGSTLRSIALAKAILDYSGSKTSLTQFVSSTSISGSMELIEINESGSLTPFLARMANYRLCSYPEYDLMELNLEDESADMVVHSDTLEHVPDPIQGLKECRRVLKFGGACCFTVPVIIGRMSRSRSGMKPSYHSDYNHPQDDQIVQTEFGADIWGYILEAGFSECRIVNLEYPAGLAYIAVKD